MMAASGAHALDYRLVYSPSQKLEVYIDNVRSDAPAHWCDRSITLRIVSGQTGDPAIMNDFLPRVGGLLERQCPKATRVPWSMTNADGYVLAQGEATKASHWAPGFTASASAQPAEPVVPPAVPVTSPPADIAPLQAFELTPGCSFRTYWENAGGGNALFIPADNALRCTDGWLNGNSTATLHLNGQNQTSNLTFFRGYPLINLSIGEQPLLVASANRERLVLGGSRQAKGSYLLLPFDALQHAWVFGGTVIVEMPRQDAADAEKVELRVEQALSAWQPLFSQQSTLTFKLVETLAADRVDPSSGSYKSVTSSAY